MQKKVLITQMLAENAKMPYLILGEKMGIDFQFHSFITIQGIDGREFKKLKINIAEHTGVIFTSRHGIDNYFRICNELNIKISTQTKYFCTTETVALYLQKFILYRKRKIFFGEDNTPAGWMDNMNKYIGTLKFLYVCSETQQDNSIVAWLKDKKCDFNFGFMYRTINNDIKKIVQSTNYDLMCFFSAGAVNSLLANLPNYKQNTTAIGAFGKNTLDALHAAGFETNLEAPTKEFPSMIAAIEEFFIKIKNKTPQSKPKKKAITPKKKVVAKPKSVSKTKTTKTKK